MIAAPHTRSERRRARRHAQSARRDTTVRDFIAEVLARPEVIEARRQVEQADQRARLVRRTRRDVEAPVVLRPLTHFNVKGTWTAEEVEPCLAPPRSSLNPAFILANGDDL